MTELHDAFDAWLGDGAVDELPRDVAIHASGCERCLLHASAFDALRTVDLSRMPEPPVHQLVTSSVSSMRLVARYVAGALAVVLSIGAGAFTGSVLLSGLPGELDGRTPAEDVLAGTPDAATPEPDARSTVSPGGSPSPDEPSPTPSPRATRSPSSATSPPTPAVAPRSTITARPTASPRPGGTATPKPTATADPTPSPTPDAPTPTPVPPSPSPPDPTPDGTCTNGIDDDGDQLVDEADPGCAIGDSELDA